MSVNKHWCVDRYDCLEVLYQNMLFDVNHRMLYWFMATYWSRSQQGIHSGNHDISCTRLR